MARHHDGKRAPVSRQPKIPIEILTAAALRLQFSDGLKGLRCLVGEVVKRDLAVG
jgi:hypothetical protein